MELEGQISSGELPESRNRPAEHVSLADLEVVALAVLGGLEAEVLEVQVELLAVALPVQVEDAGPVVRVVAGVVRAGQLVLEATVVSAAVVRGDARRDQEQREDHHRGAHGDAAGETRLGDSHVARVALMTVPNVYPGQILSVFTWSLFEQ